MSVEIPDPRFRDVLGPHVEFGRIATGCLFTEVRSGILEAGDTDGAVGFLVA